LKIKLQSLKKLKKELLLDRESLGKRAMNQNQTLDGIIKENIV